MPGRKRLLSEVEQMELLSRAVIAGSDDSDVAALVAECLMEVDDELHIDNLEASEVEAYCHSDQ